MTAFCKCGPETSKKIYYQSNGNNRSAIESGNRLALEVAIKHSNGSNRSTIEWQKSISTQVAAIKWQQSISNQVATINQQSNGSNRAAAIHIVTDRENISTACCTCHQETSNKIAHRVATIDQQSGLTVTTFHFAIMNCDKVLSTSFLLYKNQTMTNVLPYCFHDATY